MNTQKQILIVAAMAFAFAVAPILAFGQEIDNNTDKFRHRKDALVGTWEIAASTTVDCTTGEPDGAPTTPVNYTFNLGGTMTEIEANAFDGPYRSSAQGIWKHVSGRRFAAAFTNYAFNPDRTLAVTIKYWSNLTLSSDERSFTERGRARISLPDGTVIANVCFEDIGTRFPF